MPYRNEGKLGQQNVKVWTGGPLYTYESRCPRHGKASTDFIGQNASGYVFRCKGNPKPDMAQPMVDMERHTFLAIEFTCYREYKDTGGKRQVEWTWQEGDPPPALRRA